RTAAGGGSRRRRRVPRQRAPADPRRRQSDIRRAGRHGHADPSGPDAPGWLQPEEAARLRQANRGRATVTTLRGSTSDFPLESLIGLLAGTSKTGELQVRSNDRVGALGFASGRLVAAVMDDEGGENALGAIFAIHEADFEFTPWASPPDANLEAGDLVSLLKRAAEARDRLAAIREQIPDDRMRFRLSEKAADQGAVTFTPERWRALLAVNGERDVTAIAEQLRVGRMDTLTLLAGLVRDGVIETIAPPSGFAPSRNAPPPEAPAPEAPAANAPAEVPASEPPAPQPQPTDTWAQGTPAPSRPADSWMTAPPAASETPANTWAPGTPPESAEGTDAWPRSATAPEAPAAPAKPAAAEQWTAPAADAQAEKKRGGLFGMF